MNNLTLLPDIDEPILGFRFLVVFLGFHFLEFRFQSIEGLSQTVELAPRSSHSARPYPEKLVEGEITLTRGMPRISTLRREINKGFNEFQFVPRNVIISILSEHIIPTNNWLIRDAYPIEWSLSGIDANTSEVIIESMKLTYSSIEPYSL